MSGEEIIQVRCCKWCKKMPGFMWMLGKSSVMCTCEQSGHFDTQEAAAQDWNRIMRSEQLFQWNHETNNWFPVEG